MSRVAIAFALGIAACAGGGQNAPEPRPIPEPAPADPTPIARADVESEPAPAARERDASAAVPPLSSPNARFDAGTTSDAAAPPEAAASDGDPRTLALRRAGQAAQACYDQHAPRGTAGKLQLRITLGKDGSALRVEIDRAKSTVGLLGGKLEPCVVAAFQREKFQAPRGGTDVQLEVPLDFQPPAR